MFPKPFLAHSVEMIYGVRCSEDHIFLSIYIHLKKLSSGDVYTLFCKGNDITNEFIISIPLQIRL